MFQSARLRLTLWYLLIIMCISFLFSGIIYRDINAELVHVEQISRLHRAHMERLFPNSSFQNPAYDELQAVEDARRRLVYTLIFINSSILFLSGLAGYFLSGRTLKPIKTMLDEQNRFITDASHELKTPLTALRSEIEVYLLGKNRNRKEAEAILQSNLEEVIALQKLSENLMHLAKYQETQGIQKSFEKLSVLDLIENALKRVVPLARSKQIKIIHDIADTVVFGNKQELIEVFVILLDNAVKYSAAKTDVHIRSKQSQSFTDIRISDKGMGISETDLPYIFDRFYRADKSRTKKETAGYGLGLAIVQQIIDDHNGTISVKSREGKGTTFILHLPTKA